LSLPQFRETGSARPSIGMLMSSSIGSIRVGGEHLLAMASKAKGEIAFADLPPESAG
jgi:hypothetical protein